MDDSDNMTESSQSMPSSSVAHGVLEAFFDALAATEGYADVAARLRKTVLEKGTFAEKAIKSAIFDDD